MAKYETLADLRKALAARTDREGKPKAGWGPSVELIRARIAELEAANV